MKRRRIPDYLLDDDDRRPRLFHVKNPGYLSTNEKAQGTKIIADFSEVLWNWLKSNLGTWIRPVQFLANYFTVSAGRKFTSITRDFGTKSKKVNNTVFEFWRNLIHTFPFPFESQTNFGIYFYFCLGKCEVLTLRLVQTKPTAFSPFTPKSRVKLVRWSWRSFDKCKVTASETR